MSKKILYLFDQEPNLAKILKFIFKNHAEIFICPETFNSRTIEKVFNNLSQLKELKIELIDFLKYFNEKAFLIKDDYLKFIYDFSENFKIKNKNLKEYLKHTKADFSTFWFSLISEKNVNKSNSYTNLAKFLVILDLIKEKNIEIIYFDLENPEIYQILKKNLNLKIVNLKKNKRFNDLFYISYALFRKLMYILDILKKIFLAKFILKNNHLRRKILKESDYLLITYFPSFKSEKEVANRYFEPLEKNLEDEKMTYLALYTPIDNYTYKESLKIARKINKNLIFMEEYLKISDLLKAIYDSKIISFKFSFILKEITKNYKYENYNLWPLFYKDFYNSFFGFILLEGLVYYYIFKNIVKELKKDSQILYLAEFFPWEKALNIASNGKIRTIGIAHTTIPILLLNYFYYKEELEKGNHLQKLPQADFLGVSGKIPYEILKDSGYKNVFRFGAMRYLKLKEVLKIKSSWNEREDKIIAALPGALKEAQELILWLVSAFSSELNYEIILKTHYALPLEKILKNLKIKLNKSIFKESKSSLTELFFQAKASIVTGSSSSFEAIACQCPVIVPNLSSKVNINPLVKVSNFEINVYNSRKLQAETIKILNLKENPLSYEDCKKFIENYFDLLEEDEFIKRIKNL